MFTIQLIKNRLKIIDELLSYSNLLKEDINKLNYEKESLFKDLNILTLPKKEKIKNFSKLRKIIQKKNLKKQKEIYTFDKINYNKQECLIIPVYFLKQNNIL